MSTAAEDESLCSHVAHAFYNMVTHDEVRKRIVTDRSFDAIMQLRSRAASFTVQAHAAGALACLSIDNRCKDRVFSLCTRTDSQRLIAQGQELLFAGLIVRGLSRIDSNRSMLVKRGVLQILEDLWSSSHEYDEILCDTDSRDEILCCVVESCSLLAREASNAKHIVQIGLLDLIVEQCNSSTNRDILRFSTETLVWIGAGSLDEQMLDRVLVAALPALVRLCKSVDDVLVSYAAHALCQFARDERCVPAFLEAGVVDILLYMCADESSALYRCQHSCASNSDKITSRHTTLAFSELTKGSDGCNAVLRNKGNAVAVLLGILRADLTGDPQVLRKHLIHNWDFSPEAVRKGGAL